MQIEMVRIGVVVGMGVLVLIQTTVLLFLKRNIKRFMQRVEKYIAYILEDTQEVPAPMYVGEMKKQTQMNEQEKENLLQEILADYFS